MRRLCLLFVAACFACHGGTPETVSDAGPTDGGHVLPGPGIAAVWQVKDGRELVTGPSTGGHVGDWEIANSRVRFMVEDARPSDGYDPYGCGIAAADRQREAGAPGESRWGEIWMGLNFRAPGCDSISVVNDGSDGQPAILRAVGHDQESPFMASLFPQASTPPSLNATIYREYTLAPDSDALQETLTIQNDGTAALDITAPYVGMAMNRGLRHWIDGSGFDFGSTYDAIVQMNTSADFYAAVGDRISYSVLEQHSPFSPIMNFAHVLIGQYPQMHIPAGQSQSLRFVFAVGTGDTGTLQVAHKEVLGNNSALVPLSGTVTDASGVPVAAARVHVTDTAGQSSVAFARTASDGTWTAPVLTGSYGVRALTDDRPVTALQAISVPSAGLTGVHLTLGASSTVTATATDVNGHGLPAKIVLEPSPSNPRTVLPPALGEAWDRQPIVIFSPDGTATVPVFPGTWHVTFSHGFEYDLPTQDVVAPPGGVGPAAQTLHRVIDTTGWLSGDFHVHAQYSPDGDDLLSLKVRAFAADGVEVPVSTEHEFIGDFGPTAQALSLTPFMHTIAGTELTTTATGHFNIFPLTPMPGTLNNGGFRWYNRTIPDVLDEARKRLTPDGQKPVVQMNHPRASGMAYLDAVHFDPTLFAPGVDGADWTTQWDAMELWNGTPLPTFEGCPAGVQVCPKLPTHPVMNDWFAFLDRAMRITGTGNSDSHRAETSTVGYPRTYVQVGLDDPSAVTDRQVTDALRAMKVSISGGPFLTIGAPKSGTGAPDSGSGDTVQPDHSGATPTLHLTIKVQAPAWMGQLRAINVWVGDSDPRSNGATMLPAIDLSNAPIVDGVRWQGTVDVSGLTADTWVMATVRGNMDSQGNSHALWPVVQDAVPPYAITNPIWIDVDGDGQITRLRSP